MGYTLAGEVAEGAEQPVVVVGIAGAVSVAVAARRDSAARRIRNLRTELIAQEEAVEEAVGVEPRTTVGYKWLLQVAGLVVRQRQQPSTQNNQVVRVVEVEVALMRQVGSLICQGERDC